MPKKVEHYNKERADIINKLLTILEINDHNTFSLKELDTNIDKQRNIIALVPDIKKYFICSKWACFKLIPEDINRYHLSIIKNLMKNMNYQILPVRKHINNNNNVYRDTIYHIIKK